MKKNRNTLAAAAAAALILGGCVTKSTYEELKAEKDREVAALQSERDALRRQQAELQEQLRKLEAQRDVLEQNKAWLEQEQIALQTRVGLLAQEKEGLEREKTALEQEKAALEESKALLEQQQNELRQQIQALEQQKAQLLSSSQETQAQYDALVRNLTEELEKGQLQVRRYQNMLTVDVAEQLFFASGEASLKESGKQVLAKVADALKAYDDKVIRVIGHTDNVPIGKAYQKVFPSNWELSVARATTVVRYLQELGLPPERMIAAGRAEYAPIASNDTAEGRKQNRRIEITLIDRALFEEARQAMR
ncbi:MAG TPA: OmpA family protein [Burkholderiales bacterium]